MSVSIPDFWRLTLESKLLTQGQCQQLATSFGTSQGAATDVQVLAKWLIAQNVISRYQAKVLLAGRPGPFEYGDYKIYDRVESGRLAGWFRAVHAGTNHPVMLKFLTGTAAQNAALWQHIRSFVPATAHPNLVRFYEAVDLGSYKFLVCEDLRGQSLAEHLQSSGALPADEACRVAQLAANGLGHLHQSGRPHGDPRPKNVWLGTTGNVKVLAEPDVPVGAPNFSQADGNGELLARAEYLAPEYLQAGKTPDHLTDIYALGCSLYESIAARPPFAGGTVQEKMQRHAAEGIQPLDSAGAPQQVGQAVAYMMAKNPQVRYQQAADVVQQLGQFVGAAQANYKPTAAPATLPNYEAALAQKQQAAVAQPAHPAAIPATPQPAVQASRPAAAAAPVVKTAPPVVTAKKRKPSGTSGVNAERIARGKARRKNNLIMYGSAIGVAAILLIIGVIVLSRMGSGNAPQQPPVVAEANPDPVPEVASTGGNAKGDPPTEGDGGGAVEEASLVVEDDGTLLWASPTAGTVIEPKLVPGGARILIMLRPEKMLAEQEGERVLQALGPDFAAARTAWEGAAGFALSDIDRLTLSVHPNEGQFPKVCSVVQLASPADVDAMLSKWGNPSPVDGLASVYQKGATAYYIPSDGEGQVFVMGPLDSEIKSLVEGDVPPMPRDLGRLLRSSDDERHVTVLFDRNFFHTGGSQLFTGPRAKALDQLDWFFGDGVKAGLVSMHFGEPFYFEFRAQNDVTIDPQTLALNLRERADTIPKAIEDYLIKVDPPAYWARVKGRIRDMVYEWHDNTRSGVDMDQATINSALPAVAASNLAVAGEMLVTLNPGGGPVGVVAAGPSVPKTIEELLKSPISLQFGSNDMILAMQELEGTVKDTFKGLPFQFKVKIMGTHLQLEGITQNQRINDFDMQGAKLADVLTSMVRKANPITTVKDPSEVDQKLIWVVAPDPADASKKIILITTRKSAEGNYTLPEVFRPK